MGLHRWGGAWAELSATYDLSTSGPSRPGFLLVETFSAATVYDGTYRFPFSIAGRSFNPTTSPGYQASLVEVVPIQLGGGITFQTDLLADLRVYPPYLSVIGGPGYIHIGASELDGTPVELDLVPEPSSGLLLVSALALAWSLRKRKPRKFA